MGDWTMYGQIHEDDGNHTDEQLGKAASVRFVNPDYPGARVTVYAYAHAPEKSIETREGSVETFYGFEPDMENFGIETLTCYEIEDDAVSYDADEWEPDWSKDESNSLDTFIGPGGDEERVAKAEAIALNWIRSYDPKKFIDWDGKYF